MPLNGKKSYFTTLAKNLENADHGEKGRLVSNARKFWNFPRNAQVYRELEKVGWESGRQVRAGKGASSFSDEDAVLVSNMVWQSIRDNGKNGMSIKKALAVLEGDGKLSTDASPSTASRVMRAMGIHPEQLCRPMPHTGMRSLHPNHVWQLDPSLCVLFYLKNGGLGVMRESEFYKNKMENYYKILKQRVQRYVVSDHYSGAFYHEYFLGAESQENNVNFLINAMEKRPGESMHGAPLQLVFDSGSANKGQLTVNLLNSLPIKHWPHKRGNPRAKGQVEAMNRIIEREFESLLFLTKVENLAQLNELARVWRIDFNSYAIHTRHKHTRYGVWQKIRKDQLRIVNREMCELLVQSTPVSRKVNGDFTVQYKGNVYNIKHIVSDDRNPDLRIGADVTVSENPFYLPSVIVTVEARDGSTTPYVCDPVAVNEVNQPLNGPVFGENYAAPPDTKTNTLSKAMDRQAWGKSGDEKIEDIEKNKGKKENAFNGTVDPLADVKSRKPLEFMDRPGTPLNVDRPAPEARPIPYPSAILDFIVPELGRKLSQKESSSVRNLFPDGIPEHEIVPLTA
ncbi:MAG: transposase family protein, partial [Gammaproteobacteria bacterium]|nr:transposase family protein [Gammaproteobacteria bacterium]